jgi:hypothetical protein
VSVVAIVLIALVGVLLILFLGGTLANARHRRAAGDDLRTRAAAADRDLARAAAEDRGWDRAVLESAVRAAWAKHEGAAAIESIALMTVLDRPGTDEDEAMFVVTAGGRETHVALARRGDVWSEAAQPSGSAPAAT